MWLYEWNFNPFFYSLAHIFTGSCFSSLCIFHAVGINRKKKSKLGKLHKKSLNCISRWHALNSLAVECACICQIFTSTHFFLFTLVCYQCFFATNAILGNAKWRKCGGVIGRVCGWDTSICFKTKNSFFFFSSTHKL